MQETSNIIHFKLLLNSSNLLKKVFSLNWPTNAITSRTFLWLKVKKNIQIGLNTQHGSKMLNKLHKKRFCKFIHRNKVETYKGLMNGTCMYSYLYV